MDVISAIRSTFKHYRKENETMNEKLIYGGEVTLEDLYRLNQLGFEFVIEDGVITNVSH